jgi:hypothetical protein
VYLSTNQTTDQSPLYVKVDTGNSDDDWVMVPLNKDEGNYTMEGDWTWATDNRVYFRDTGLYLYSPANGDLQVVTDGQFIVSGGSGLRLASTTYEYITLTPDMFNVAMSASLILGTMRGTGLATGCFPALQYAGAGDLTAYGPYIKVPSNAASSGSVLASAQWSCSTDGDAAVFRIGYDYVATAEGPATTTGSYLSTAAASCVSGSAINSSCIDNLPSFTAGEFFAVRLEHMGSSGSDDSGSTTDVTSLTLRYVVDRLGETT